MSTSWSLGRSVSAPEFSAQMPLSEKLQAVASRAQYFTGATGVAVVIKEADDVVCRASCGATAPGVGVRLQDETSFTYQCLRAGRPMKCDDACNDPRVDAATCKALSICSIAGAPVRHGDDVQGVIVAFSDALHGFTEAHMAVLTALGEATGKFLIPATPASASAQSNNEQPPATDEMPAVAESKQAEQKAHVVQSVSPTPAKETQPETKTPVVRQNKHIRLDPITPPAEVSKPSVGKRPEVRLTGISASRESRAEPQVVPAAESIAPSRPEKRGSIVASTPRMKSAITPPALPGIRQQKLSRFSSAKSSAANLTSAYKFESRDAVIPESPFSLSIPDVTSPDIRKYTPVAVAVGVVVLVFFTWTWHSHAKRAAQSWAQIEPAMTQNVETAEQPAVMTSAPASAVNVMNANVMADKANAMPAKEIPGKPTPAKPTKTAEADDAEVVFKTPPFREGIADAQLIRRPVAVAKTAAVAAPALDEPPRVAISEVLPPVLTTPTVAVPTQPAVVASKFVPSEPVKKVPPVFPEMAAKAHIQGKVILTAKIGSDGNVKEVKVVSGPPVFQQAAIDAVKHWHYKPAILNDKPVESTADITLNFSNPR